MSSELPAAARGHVELAVRTDGELEFWFLINRSAEPVEVREVDGELLVGERARPSSRERRRFGCPREGGWC